MPVFPSEEAKYLDSQLRPLSASQQDSIDNVGDEGSNEEEEDVSGVILGGHELSSYSQQSCKCRI